MQFTSEAPSPHSTTDRIDVYETSDESANLSGDTMNQFQVGDRVKIKDSRLGTVVKIMSVQNGLVYLIEVDNEGMELFGDAVKICPVSITESAKDLLA